MKEYTFAEVMNKTRDLLNDIGRYGGFCCGVDCEDCVFCEGKCQRGFGCGRDFMLECPEEFVKIVMNCEPPVDWSKVEVDTPILVRDDDAMKWLPRYFAKYENEKVYAWHDGCTSLTCYGRNDCSSWDYVKLYKPESEDE